ncbi:SHOCT domain-containing protein [Halorarum halophilum]|uniref:SHOCT domain-containing protein n=1 Tax=Halorarum halophilum TaxID=2743090 RepID=A0A7D5GBL6_9EURY|nr:SHOCT domain-containing protein [Halobaculum halophilum]QLG27612.1 SHOCT domain-containing protein [Halobaculum halophilum]
MTGLDTSPLRRLHRLLEHYTPDGTLGRLLLGGPLLVLAPVLFFGGFAMVTGAMSFLVFVTGLVFLLASPPSLVLGVVCLWPVYLSLIGNLESPEAYPGTNRPTGRSDYEEDANPEATLKRRYAEGDITREEFEERLDALLDAGELGRGRGRRRTTSEREREMESAR